MMRRGLAAIVALLLVLAQAGAATAQDRATLVADRVAVVGDGRLVAEGNVEVLYRETRLRAERIVYDRGADSIALEGPLRLDEGDGAVLVADAAELSGDLRDGILQSARLVLDRRLQIAANSVERVGGRYTRLNRTVASSCEVCAKNPTPLWEIRAASVIHDQQERQLYFDRAQFRLLGVPLFYAPRLRLPDPTRERATGFLRPEITATDKLGPGLRLPYFMELGPDRDLTLTPYIAQRRTATLEARYRQAFATGVLELEGGVSRDTIRPGRTRGYLVGSARFALPGDFTLEAQIETASDRRYLEDYGHSSQDRLTSGVALERVRRDTLLRAEALAFRSLRRGDDNSILPGRVGALRWERRFDVPGIGGVARARFDALALARSARSDIDGRDVARARFGLDLRREWVLPGGIQAALLGEVVADHYAIRQDSRFSRRITRVTPAAALEFRWPWRRIERSGAVQVIEPVAQLVWARARANAVPNDDSRLVEFDEGNLFSLDRAPGADARELGRRANLGVRWTRHDPDGWSAGVTLGRVLRFDGAGGFSALSGLDGRRSDWLAAAHVDTSHGLTLANRTLFDDNLDVTKSEFRMQWLGDGFDLATSLAHLPADPGLPESRPQTTSEWSVDGGYRFAPGWVARADWRFDLASGEASRAGVGLVFTNECIDVDLSLSRRFASSTSVGASTRLGLTVELLGFGGGAPQGGRACGT